jgi:KDO2-lipid IV(A) lauroyltransferase
LRNALELLIFFILSFPLAILPHTLAKKAGGLIGVLVYSLWGKRRQIAVENLRAALERNALAISTPPEALIKENFKNLGYSLAEVIKIYYGLGDNIVRSVLVKGEENFRKAKDKGKGVIFITGHCGNWELLALAFSSKVESLGVVARPLDNRYLNSRVERVRERFGNRVIYKRGALKAILSSLKEGGAVGILMDQAVVPDEGVVVDFLGAPAWTTRMPAAIAKRTQAAVLPVFIRRTKNGHEITVHPEAELTGDEVEDTKRLSGFIEDYIKENPSEWLWIHRRWKRA